MQSGPKTVLCWEIVLFLEGPQGLIQDFLLGGGGGGKKTVWTTCMLNVRSVLGAVILRLSRHAY